MTEENKIYTATDLAHYHSGIMPPDEMHALEKAALEDPFLADALEGYMHATDVKKDIAELKDRLAEKRKMKNVFSLSSFDRWWRIAALFIIMVGAGYFFYRLNYVNKENSLAKNEIKASVEKEDSTPLVKNDSVTTKDSAAENQQASTFQQKEKIVLKPVRPSIKKDVTMQQMDSTIVIAPLNKSKNDSYAFSTYNQDDKKEYAAKLAREYVLKGKVTDEKGNVVPFANITDKAGNKATVTDTAGNFFLRSQDSSITAMASASGYASKSFTLKKDVQPTIAMNKTNAELEEVVVTAYDKRKQVKESTSASKALNGKVAGIQMTSAGFQPYGGQEKFDLYLKENTTPIYNENNERLTAEVLLSFTINKKGRPKNIKVVKSSCATCEQEAIKLLQNGPDWTGKKDKEGTVVIKF